MTAPAPFAAGAALDPLPLFVYGTLLPGQPLAGAVAPHVRSAQPASVRGRLLWHRCGRFPVLVDDVGSRTWGLRVEVEPDLGLLAVLAAEELACGYEGRWLPASASSGALLGPALAFTWPWGPDTCGAEIEGGRFTPAAVLAAGYDVG